MSGKEKCPFCGEEFPEGKPLNVHKIYCEEKSDGETEIKRIDEVLSEDSSNMDLIQSFVNDLDDESCRKINERIVRELRDINQRIDSFESVDESSGDSIGGSRLFLELVRHYNNRVVGRLNEIQEELEDNGFIDRKSPIPEFRYRDRIDFGDEEKG